MVRNMSLGAFSGITGVAMDSVAANNGIGGFVASSPSTRGGVGLTVRRSLAHANAYGYLVDGSNAAIILAEAMASSNSVSQAPQDEFRVAVQFRRQLCNRVARCGHRNDQVLDRFPIGLNLQAV